MKTVIDFDHLLLWDLVTVGSNPKYRIIRGSGYLFCADGGKLRLDIGNKANSLNILPVAGQVVDLRYPGKIELVLTLDFIDDMVVTRFIVNGVEVSIPHFRCPGGCEVIVSLEDTRGLCLFRKILHSNESYPRVQKRSITPTIRIYTPTVRRFDAVGNYVNWMRDLFINAGAVVKVYAANISSDCEQEISDSTNLFYEIKPTDLLIVHYSTFDALLPSLLRLENTKIAFFHNITPAHFFRDYDIKVFDHLSKGSAQLRELEVVDLLLANSSSSARSLNNHFEKPKEIVVLPPLSVYAPRLTRGELGNDGLNILVVGRLVPNKRIHIAINILSHVLEACPRATLTIVGSTDFEPYVRQLKLLTSSLGLSEEQVNLTGPISDSRLEEIYGRSNFLLALSEHEGFCVPVFEAMVRRCVVCAVPQEAVLEVLGGTGIVLDNLDSLSEVTSLILKYAQDEALYNTVADAQFVRAQYYSQFEDGKLLLDSLKEYWRFI